MAATITWLPARAARVAKAQADPRTLGSAIRIFTAHLGALPVALTDLTQATTNGLGHNAGPFIAHDHSVRRGPRVSTLERWCPQGPPQLRAGLNCSV